MSSSSSASASGEQRFYVLFTGGRRSTDRDGVRDVLRLYQMIYGPAFRVVVGCAKSGTDLHVRELCEEMGITYRVYRADWKRYGKRAGFIRNTEMVKNLRKWHDEHGYSIQAVAFPGDNGTAHCSREAESHGLHVDYMPEFTA